MKETTGWPRVAFFGRLAGIVSEYLKKGSSVYLEGRIRTRKWQAQDGTDRYSTEIVAEQMQMPGGRGGASMGGGDEGGYSRGEPRSVAAVVVVARCRRPATEICLNLRKQWLEQVICRLSLLDAQMETAPLSAPFRMGKGTSPTSVRRFGRAPSDHEPTLWRAHDFSKLGVLAACSQLLLHEFGLCRVRDVSLTPCGSGIADAIRNKRSTFR